MNSKQKIARNIRPLGLVILAIVGILLISSTAYVVFIGENIPAFDNTQTEDSGTNNYNLTINTSTSTGEPTSANYTIRGSSIEVTSVTGDNGRSTIELKEGYYNVTTQKIVTITDDDGSVTNTITGTTEVHLTEDTTINRTYEVTDDSENDSENNTDEENDGTVTREITIITKDVDENPISVNYSINEPLSESTATTGDDGKATVDVEIPTQLVEPPVESLPLEERRHKVHLDITPLYPPEGMGDTEINHQESTMYGYVSFTYDQGNKTVKVVKVPDDI